MSRTCIRKLLDRANRRPGAILLRSVLMPAGWLYDGLTATRNRLFDTRICAAYRPAIFTISIGNITAGGTGKTPIVIWLINKLTQAGYKPAVLTRGYKSNKGKIADEPAIIEHACPGVKVLISSNRVASAKHASYELARNILVLDDGFQHRRLARDIDILAIDATCPFGYGRLLPAGLLRENIKSIGRAHVVIITRCDLVSQDELDGIIWTIRNIKPDIEIALSRHKLGDIQFGNTGRTSLAELAGKKVFAFCGIGNPDAFFEQLTKNGLIIARRIVFPDHHNYTQSEFDTVLTQTRLAGAVAAITTEKDYLKLEHFKSAGDVKLGFAPVTLEFLEGGDTIYGFVEKEITAAR